MNEMDKKGFTDEGRQAEEGEEVKVKAKQAEAQAKEPKEDDKANSLKREKGEEKKEDKEERRGKEMMEEERKQKQKPIEKPGKKRKRGCLARLFSFLLVVIIIAAGVIASPLLHDMFKNRWATPIPGSMILKSASYTGTADDENATFNMKLDYETFVKFGWIKIPVLPVSVAVSEVTLNNKPVYLYAGDKWYEVITRRKGKSTIEAKFSLKVKESQGVRHLSFDVPRTTATSAEVQIKGTELEVKVDNSQHKEVVAQGENTLVKVTYPPVNRISLVWNRARPELEEKDARLYSETNTVCSILEGILHCNTKVHYSILRAWINGLKLSLPEDVNIMAVTGNRIRDWKVVTESGKRILQIEFSYKVQGQYDLNLVYEKPISLNGRGLSMPAISSLGVEREKGYIGIEALTNVEVATGKTDSIVNIDVDELPAELRTMTSRPLILGYKYVEQPYNLALEVKRHEDMSLLSMVADSALHMVMMTSDGRRISRVFYSLRNNGSQFLSIYLPEGSELWSASIAGKSVKVMQAEKGKLLIPLMSTTRGSGYVGVEVVYAEEGTKPDPKTGGGGATVQLPAVSGSPIIHLMCELYLPKEGKYREKDFVSDAKMVNTFSSVKAVGAPEMPSVPSEQVSRNLQARVQQKFRQEITAAGGTPVSIKLPLDGQLFRFEKILVLEEKVKIGFKYTGLGGKR